MLSSFHVHFAFFDINAEAIACESAVRTVVTMKSGHNGNLAHMAMWRTYAGTNSCPPIALVKALISFPGKPPKRACGGFKRVQLTGFVWKMQRS